MPKQQVIDPPVLLQALLTGEQSELDYAEMTAIKVHLGPALDAIAEIDKKLSEQKRAHEIGEKFRFRGQHFLVAKHGSTTPWKKAFELAIDMLSATKRRVAQTAAEDLKTDTKKVKEIS